LQLDFGDLSLRFGDLRDELAAFALQLRLFALQGGEATELNEIFLPQIADALELLLDQGDALVLGVLLRRKPNRFAAAIG
jgi:hypothetical protein